MFPQLKSVTAIGVDVLSDLRDGISPTDQATGWQMSGREELARYKATRVPGQYKNALEYSKESSRDLPLLSMVETSVMHSSKFCSVRARLFLGWTHYN